MTQTDVFSRHVDAYEQWYERYPEVYQSEVEAIREQLRKLPENIKGIEVGLGTGRFSSALDLKEGVEPSAEMAEKAIKRGIEVIHAKAEHLPYSDLHFDFILFVTVCYLDNLKRALKEARRVLKNDGHILIGFIDAGQTIAKAYTERKKESIFYKDARFRTVDEISKILTETGFKDLEFVQTLFGELDEIDEIEVPKTGHGEGSFVVVKAVKR